VIGDKVQLLIWQAIAEIRAETRLRVSLASRWLQSVDRNVLQVMKYALTNFGIEAYDDPQDFNRSVIPVLKIMTCAWQPAGFELRATVAIVGNQR
jgi:hypothetical protein